jgi:translation initiation factor 2B subunit (eIF-2B alpha/beta/delta family)
LRIQDNNRNEVKPLDEQVQQLKERLYKNEKEIASLRQFEKFTMDQIAHNSKILDLVQIDVAKIKREGGDGIVGVIQKEMEEFKKKMEEAQ